jgi:hypothetical protein
MPSVAVAVGERGDPRGVQARSGLRHTEAHVQAAIGDAGQRTPLELLGSVLDHRVHAEDRQVDRARGVHATARAGDLLDQDRGLGDPETVTAELLRRRDAEPAAGRERVVELGRELVREILLHPVLVVEVPHDRGDRLADRRLVIRQIEVHRTHLRRSALVISRISFIGPTVTKD